MERIRHHIRQMYLKKALFTIVCINITAALALSLLSFWGCIAVRSQLAANRTIINIHSAPFLTSSAPEPTAQTDAAVDIISVVQILLPVLIYIFALFTTASMFYRLKLKEPLAVLASGASRIIENDLDFTIEAASQDELGQLCTAFETMRHTLLDNNRELWRQAEERRRLNAAFSHNLRNPVTVLKGAAKLAEKSIARNPPEPGKIAGQIALITNYAGRIEHYIETMSSIQRLEETPVERENIPWDTLVAELRQTVYLIGMDHDKQIHFHTSDHPKTAPVYRSAQTDPSAQINRSVSLDRSILFQIAENLLSNALRFARQNIDVSCSVNETILELSVADDGGGFPASLIRDGVRPFHKGREDAEHLGMGLYTCKLLCERHGGTITIQNHAAGSFVSASLKIQPLALH